MKKSELDMQPQALVIFSKKSGKIKENSIILGISNALMRGYIYQNGLKKTEDAIIFGLNDGLIKYSFIGNGDFPEQRKDSYHGAKKIEDIYEGLLAECNEMWANRNNK